MFGSSITGASAGNFMSFAFNLGQRQPRARERWRENIFRMSACQRRRVLASYQDYE
jgi:hypothetical protein